MIKKYLFASIATLVFLTGGLIFFPAGARQKLQAGYILEHENDIMTPETGPHNGGGQTTAYRFFPKAGDSKLRFTKRVLHPGSAIGYHLQKEEEIYYIVSGTGELTMNGEILQVGAGDGLLTLAGNSHGLRQTGKEDLVVIINYAVK